MRVLFRLPGTEQKTSARSVTTIYGYSSAVPKAIATWIATSIPHSDCGDPQGCGFHHGLVHDGEYLETNVPDAFAAGDAANYRDLLFERRRRVEHWHNAVSKGQRYAKILMGERTPFPESIFSRLPFSTADFQSGQIMR